MPADSRYGRMTESMTFDPDDWRSKSPDFTGETFRRNMAVVERLKGLARERDISLPQLAVAWTLTNPAVDVAIVGARRPSQLDETAAAADIDLSVHWVLGRSQAFLLTTGDVGILPRLLDAAERFDQRPSDQAMDDLTVRRQVEPLFA